MRSDNVEKNRNTDFQYLNQLNWIWQLPVKNRRHPNEMPAFCNYTADETAGMLKKMQSDSAHHIYFICVDLKRRNIPKIDGSAIISVLSFYAWNFFFVSFKHSNIHKNISLFVFASYSSSRLPIFMAVEFIRTNSKLRQTECDRWHIHTLSFHRTNPTTNRFCFRIALFEFG